MSVMLVSYFVCLAWVLCFITNSKKKRPSEKLNLDKSI